MIANFRFLEAVDELLFPDLRLRLANDINTHTHGSTQYPLDKNKMNKESKIGDNRARDHTAFREKNFLKWNKLNKVLSLILYTNFSSVKLVKRFEGY